MEYYERGAPQVTLSDGLWQKLQSLANKSDKFPVDLPSVFEEGLNFEMGEIMEGNEGNNDDDEILFETTDHPIDDANSLQTRFNIIQNLFSTSIPDNLDKASAVMRDMTEALRNGNVATFDECEGLLHVQFRDDEANQFESE